MRALVHACEVVWAFLVRDAAMAVSYRLEFVLQLATVLFHVSALFFLSNLIGANAELDRWGGYLPFAAVGLAVASYFQTGFDSFAKAIHREQLHGTLESLLLAPLRLPLVVIACAAWRFLWTAVLSVVYLASAALLFGMELRGNPALALALLVLTTLAFASLGVISASFVMVYKRGDPMGLLVGGVSALLGGVFYPVSALPPALQWAAWCLPITHGLHAIRSVLLEGASIDALWRELLALTLFAAVLVPIAFVAFRAAVRRSKREGTLLHF